MELGCCSSLKLNFSLVLLFLSNGGRAYGSLQDNTGTEVQLMQMWVGDGLVPLSWSEANNVRHPHLDFSRCASLPPSGSAIHLVDCSGPIREMARIPGSDQLTPILLRPTYRVYETSPGDFESVQGICSLIEILTISPKAVLERESFRGIGFYVGATGEVTLIGKESLQPIGGATLAGGGDGLVHRFIGWGFCSGNGESSHPSSRETFELKPFAQHESVGLDGNFAVTRVWESVRFNHKVSCLVPEIDRRRELLSGPLRIP